jgi:hypothetical protein
MRLTREKLDSALPQRYLESLRASATVVWTRSEIQRAYAVNANERLETLGGLTPAYCESTWYGGGASKQTA